MTFRVADLREIAQRLSMSQSPISIIVAPNFESRSTSITVYIDKILTEAKIDKRRIFWFVLTLQGTHPPEVLDALKAVHTRAVMSRLWASGYYESQVTQKTISYPIASERFASEMANLMRGVPQGAELIVDFSALPRNLLSTLLGQVSSSGSSATPFPTVQRVWLTYAWAHRYPQAGPEIVGGIIGQFSHLRLRELLRDKTHAEIVLFTSGSGHDAYEVLEASREAGLGNQINVHVVSFIHRENFSESYRNLRNHYGLIREGQRMGVKIGFVFSVNHALVYMREVAQACSKIRNQGNHTLFALAPFGPKPIAVAAHFVRREYLNLINDASIDEADVLNSTGTQYLSPYSLGTRSYMGFSYEPGN